ncbi:MAG TPA: hypothetical protein VIQ03_15200 [Gammaproteobacteria bacterium]
MNKEGLRLWPIKIGKVDKQRLESLRENALSEFGKVLKEEGIEPTSQMIALLSDVYLPLADWLTKHISRQPLVVGINGAQGTGKSTLSKILQLLLDKGFEKKAVCLSLDDFYLSHHQRQILSQTVHPLLKTRGVPGTHDVELMLSVLSQLKQKTKQDIIVPVFDKSIDDRLPESDWLRVSLPVDMVIFEGWCVGAKPEDASSLLQPVNQLEQDEDEDGRWRRYVNQQLAEQYQNIFDQLDFLLMLQPPSMKKIYDWRLLQEQKLQKKTMPGEQTRIMSADEVRRFIMHYERITRHALTEMSDRADIVLKLNNDHLVDNVIFNAAI